MSEETGVKLVVKAQGVWVEDAEGKRWFDILAGMWLKNIGHGRGEIAEAVYQQMQEISFSPGDTVTPVTVKLAAKIASLAPDKDSRVFFVSGGSEAVETALKMAKKYHKIKGEPARYKVISRRGSYHGATQACISLGGGGLAAPEDYGPLMPGSIQVAAPNEYRCAFCRDRGGCNLECAREVERAIQYEGPSTVAALIGEPISASAGIHVPHDEYWPTIRQVCDRYGVLMILDEVITGFGRTGKMFASEHWGVKPDIFTVAKALTSGYLPIGATVASKKVADAFTGEGNTLFRHLFTFGGNPVSCAAGLANLQIVENEGLVANSARMGAYLFERLQSLYGHPMVGHVRGGKGLFCAVELVKDRNSKERFPEAAGLRKKIAPIMAHHGLLGRGGDVIFLAPPLCITREEVDHLVTQVNGVITELESTL
jgi:adenosylmethionine-8-amino-7-oxononanoate aminotransferase